MNSAENASVSGAAAHGPAYYRANATAISGVDQRLRALRDAVAELPDGPLLDVACGGGVLLDELAALGRQQLVGVDVRSVRKQGSWAFVEADLARGLPFAERSFQVVTAGEIIEHLVNPDAFLREVRRVLVPGGCLVISTPNLVSWANRILVPLGIQPLGTETSSEIALGRRFRVLGQGNQVQGHLKLFTARSLAQILERYDFTVLRRYGAPAFFPAPVDRIDRVMSRWVPLASDLVFLAQSTDQPWSVPPAGRRHQQFTET